MIRTARSAVLTAALATAALISVPAVASADAQDHGRESVTFDCGRCQIAGGDIFNAGRDNIVGNHDGPESPVGAPTPIEFVEIRVDDNVRSGLALVSQRGSGKYPVLIPPNTVAIVEIHGPSHVEYRSLGRRGLVQIGVNESEEDPSCLCSGDLVCQINGSSPIVIDVLVSRR